MVKSEMQRCLKYGKGGNSSTLAGWSRGQGGAAEQRKAGRDNEEEAAEIVLGKRRTSARK